MKKVLIITYYWPPSGGSAVLRWLKFVKYLRNFGWEPVVYTPLNPEPQETDESLIPDIPVNQEILKKPIVEPYGIYKFITGKKQHEKLGVALMDEGKKKGILSKLSLWIRSNLFIPDPRILWVRPSVRYLTTWLREHPADAIISTGPPHSMHLIGLGIKRRTNLKWIADFRDPWTGIDFYKQLRLTKWADRKHRKLEKKVLSRADHVITVSPGMTGDFRKAGIHNITTITNGYDEVSEISDSEPSDAFTIVHLGSMPASRNPDVLWRALTDLVHERIEIRSFLKIKLIGKTDITVKESIRSAQLEQFVTNESYIPHADTLKLLSLAPVLLLIINNSENAKGILTNKFFEYLAAKRPIIAIGPTDGDVAFILTETGAGRIFSYDDLTGIKSHLSALFDLYSQNLLNVQLRNIEKYSRKNLTAELAGLLNELIVK